MDDQAFLSELQNAASLRAVRGRLCGPGRRRLTRHLQGGSNSAWPALVTVDCYPHVVFRVLQRLLDAGSKVPPAVLHGAWRCVPLQ